MNKISIIHDKSLQVDTNETKAVARGLLFFAYVIPIFTISGGTIANIISIIETVIILLLFFDDDFYLLMPVVLFFYSFLIISGTIVIYRIYTILFILKMFVQNKKFIHGNYSGILIVVYCYCLLVLIPFNFRLGIATIFDMTFVMMYVTNYLDESEKINRFLKFFTFAAIGAGIFGLLKRSTQMNTYVLVGGEWLAISRMIATFIDPNYLGFFFNIAIFANLILKLFKRRMVRIFVVLFLYYILISTLSLTGILCNLIGLLLYLCFVKKMKVKYIMAFISIAAISVVAFSYSLRNHIPYISDFALRINSKIYMNNTENIGDITSYRSVLWSNHLRMLIEQPVYKILIGGNRIAPISLDKSLFNAVSHQEYIDELLNVGIIGFTIMILCYSSSAFRRLRKYHRKKDNTDLAILFAKYVWLFYGFGLTMFLDSKFTLFFLL